MLTVIPNGPGIEIVAHRYSPATHPDNGFGQTRPPVYMPKRDPYHGLGSLPRHGWEAAVIRRGLSDAYINDNPRGLSEGEAAEEPGFFSNLFDSVKSTVTDAVGSSVKEGGKIAVQSGTQRFQDLIKGVFTPSSDPSAPAAPVQIVSYATGAAKSNPMTTALIVGGAIAAGVLLLRGK